jgi:GT2 family glycosyltransferase
MPPDLTETAATPAAAWTAGAAAGRRGDWAAAVLWLERAARLAPRDPRVVLDLANARVALGGAAQLGLAGSAFDELVRKYDLAAGWLGLLTVRRLLGDHAGAAAALRGLLARHCVPDDPGFAEVAALVAADAGFDGWSGVSAAGDIVVVGGGALGPPFDQAALARVEGVVTIVDGVLAGWAVRPAAQGAPLTLRDAEGAILDVKFGSLLPPDESAPFTQRHSFAVPASRMVGLAPPFRLTGPDGKDIYGSPADPRAQSRRKPVAATYCGPRVRELPPRAKLAVVMPIYRDFAITKAALDSVLASVPAGVLVVVVNDASPERDLSAWAARLAAAGRIFLVVHPENRGFPAAVNSGIAAAQGCDILLVNADILLTPGAVTALAAAAYSAPEIGTATPLSNEATILSVPSPAGPNKMPDLSQTAALQRLAQQANGGQTVEIPVGVGFCLFIRHDCLAATGYFRPEIFAQGYGEEVDFCLRARQAGFRHVAALGAYVAHHGGTSFRAAGRALNARNAAIIGRLYPGYDQLIARHIAADPLRAARRRLDAARFTAGRAEAGAVLLIARDMAAIRESGRRPLLLTPAFPEKPKDTPFPWDTELTDGKPGDYPNLRFRFPAQAAELLDLLHGERVERVVFHHALGHHPAIRGIAAALAVPQDFVIHDYASFCPRITLLTRGSRTDPPRYCGEPNLAGCEACYAANGSETFEPITPTALAARSAAEFSRAETITAPSADAARRITRHFPRIRPIVTPWEDDSAPVKLTPPRQGSRRVVVVGGIGPSKGFDILMECARDATRRRLKLEFFVAGVSADDAELLETNRIFVTGPYKEGEATALIQSLAGDLAFLPSIWPETWCFALSEAWRAGLYTLAFDLGAQGQRIKSTGRGAVLPLGLPIPRVNDALLSWMPPRT